MNGLAFESHSNTSAPLRYRLVFSTKSRRKALAGIEDAVHAILREAQEESDFKILEMGVDLGDQLHLLVTFKPALSIEQVVYRLKMLATHKLWALEPAALGRHYSGAKKRLWSGGYFASTVGTWTPRRLPPTSATRLNSGLVA